MKNYEKHFGLFFPDTLYIQEEYLKVYGKTFCWRPVCLVTHNVSSKAKNSFILAILPRHCFI